MIAGATRPEQVRGQRAGRALGSPTADDLAALAAVNADRGAGHDARSFTRR